MRDPASTPKPVDTDFPNEYAITRAAKCVLKDNFRPERTNSRAKRNGLSLINSYQ